jgi:hypothetical protein
MIARTSIHEEVVASGAENGWKESLDDLQPEGGQDTAQCRLAHSTTYAVDILYSSRPFPYCSVTLCTRTKLAALVPFASCIIAG